MLLSFHCRSFLHKNSMVACQSGQNCILVTLHTDFSSEKAINVDAMRRAIITGLEDYLNGTFKYSISCQPSSQPSFTPTISKAPTLQPSMSPLPPTMHPTARSSFVPTALGTSIPSQSMKPSTVPTISAVPSTMPSDTPSSVPSTKQISFQFAYSTQYTVPTPCVQRQLNALTLSTLSTALNVVAYSVRVDVNVLVAPISKLHYICMNPP